MGILRNLRQGVSRNLKGLGHFGRGTLPHLGVLLAMVINHLLNGMIVLCVKPSLATIASCRRPHSHPKWFFAQTFSWAFILSPWWFQRFCIFTPILGGDDPIWHVLFSNGWLDRQLVLLPRFTEIYPMIFKIFDLQVQNLHPKRNGNNTVLLGPLNFFLQNRAEMLQQTNPQLKKTHLRIQTLTLLGGDHPRSCKR